LYRELARRNPKNSEDVITVITASLAAEDRPSTATGVTVTKYVKYGRKRTFVFHLLAENQFASQEGICSME
jgi:hypothetical protein